MKIRDLRHHTRNAILMAAAAVSLLACGGGGGSSSPTSMRAHSAARTFGTVRAFGSVFVDGHEFDSSGATVVDDDTGATVPGSAAGSSLAVGMTVDVKPSASSTDAAPSAQEIRVITLARGPVDASDSMAGQLSVMGQVVQLTATSVFKDARSCAQGTSPMCTPITDQSGLTANCSHSGTAAYTCTSGSGTSVQVFGYVNASASTSTLTATLVRAIDNTASIFKATGSLSIASTGAAPASYAINGLGFASGMACASPIDCNLSSGQVVTARGTTAPMLGTPGSTLPIPVTFTPTSLHLSRASSLTVGDTVELEGIVSNAMGSTYMVEGITVTLAAGQTLPTNGDTIEVTGTVTSAAPPAIMASTEEAEDGADHRKGGGFLLEDTLAVHAASAMAPATTPPSYTLPLLGTSVQVNSLTHIEDETATMVTAFDINNFKSYIDAYVAAGGATGMPHVVVRGYIDKSSGSAVLVALDLRITSAPATSAGFNARVGGVITATTMSGFSVAGVTIPFAGTAHDPSGAVVTLQQGDYVLVRLTDSGGMLSGVDVVDYGPKMDHGGG